MEDFKILSIAEIKKLNEEGFTLDASGTTMYMQGFLINSEQNQASDPVPYKVAKFAVDKIAKTAVGRPWIPKPLPNGNHVRPYPEATVEEIISYQKDFAAGEMVAVRKNEDTGNIHAIIAVFPENKQQVLNGDYAPLNSPMLGNYKIENDEVVDAEIIHLQSVKSSGYSPVYAKMNGVCEGPLNECMTGLRTLAAAGKLEPWRKSSCPCPEKFLNTSQTLGSASMPLDPPIPPASAEPPKDTAPEGGEAKAEQAMKLAEEVKTEVAEIKTMVVEEEKKIEELVVSNNEVVQAVQAIAPEAKVKPVDKPGAETPATPPAPTTMAAAGLQIQRLSKKFDEQAKVLKETQSELTKLKKDTEADKIKTATEMRTNQAITIVSGEIILKKFTPKDDKEKEARVKHYVELKKKDSEELTDLSLLAENYASIVGAPTEEKPETLGSFGELTDDYAISGGIEPDYDAIERSILEQ